jgi:hypothetical protein
LACERGVYGPGEIVEFYLIFENIGQEDVCVNWASMPLDVLFVLPAGCESITDACFSDMPWSYPGIIYFAAGAGVKLAPGECRAFQHAWDTGDDPAPPGQYTILSGLFEPTFDAAIGAFRLPATGVSLPVTISAEVPADVTSFGIMKALFR